MSFQIYPSKQSRICFTSNDGSQTLDALELKKDKALLILLVGNQTELLILKLTHYKLALHKTFWI